MSTDIKITTDGTVAGTKLIVDGKDETTDNKIVSINMYANAPYKSKYSGDNIPGNVMCSYEYATDKGTIERKTIGSADTDFLKGIGEKVVSDDSVIRHIGHQADKAVVDLIDNIIAKSTELKAKCPTKEVLLSRSLTSLQDKATDLGIKIENTEVKK